MHNALIHQIFDSFDNLTSYLNSKGLLNSTCPVQKKVEILLRTIFSNDIVVFMRFVYVIAFYDIRMVEGPKYFYLILHHLHTGGIVIFEVNYLDCARVTSATMNSAIYYTTETFANLPTDIIHIGSDFFLLLEKPMVFSGLLSR